jgi:hypothetical protein
MEPETRIEQLRGNAAQGTLFRKKRYIRFVEKALSAFHIRMKQTGFRDLPITRENPDSRVIRRGEQ